jgi:hypothetical protein
VAQLLQLSTFNGLRELIVVLAATGHISNEMTDRIYRRMAPPLDDEALRDDGALALLRQALDESFADARLGATYGMLEDRDD